MARKYATSSFEPPRRARDDARRLIAERTARLILECGLNDWALAKRKAARQLGLEDARVLPDHDEITAALQSQQSLFHAASHAAQLRAKRAEALRWMLRLEAYSPALVGGVAEGWATPDTETRIELSADSAKEIEFALLNAGVSYRHLSENPRETSAEFGIEGENGPLRLLLRSLRHRREQAAAPGARRIGIPELQRLLGDG